MENNIEVKDPNTKDETTDHSGGVGEGTAVELRNCSCHSFDGVTVALMQAIKCTATQGRRIATIVHNKGKHVVFNGDALEAENVALILESHGLVVKLIS